MRELDFSILSKLRPRKSRSGRQPVNLLNKTFGRLTPLGLLGFEAGGAKWLCHCSCGNFSIVKATKLLLDLTTSCGCYRDRLTGNRVRTHGESRSQLHRLWGNINSRCRNPKVKSYADYGARGITICERWRKYENFRDDILGSIGERPSTRHTIDRIDNNKDYEPDNVRWATYAEQRRNTRHIRNLTVNNETRCLVDWGKIVGLEQSVIARRLRRGWSPEEALNFKERKLTSRGYTNLTAPK